MIDILVPNSINIELVEVGQDYGFNRLISDEDVQMFIELTGDKNPIHCDVGYARSKGFPGPIVHGQLLSSFFSTIVGMLCPGHKSLYLSQTSKYKRPVFAKDDVLVRGRVKAVHYSISTIVLDTTIEKDGVICVAGEAWAKFI
jgi:3-hydroxybutyryl-CoA dehydratase